MNIQEVNIRLGDDLTLILVNTKYGPRPLRYDGRDFIKVLYTGEGKNIYQTFYKSTGLHIQDSLFGLSSKIKPEELQENANTKGAWFPTDGIIIQDKHGILRKIVDGEIEQRRIKGLMRLWNPETYILKLDYMGGKLAQKYFEISENRKKNFQPNNVHPTIDALSEYLKTNEKQKWYRNEEDNKYGILTRLGTKTMCKISYLLSAQSNEFWVKGSGKLVKDLFKFEKEPYSPHIHYEGVNTDYLSVNHFIGTAVSFNWTNNKKYTELQEKFGVFDYRTCNSTNTLLGKFIFEPAFKAHCASEKAKQYNEKFNEVFNQPRYIKLMNTNPIPEMEKNIFNKPQIDIQSSIEQLDISRSKGPRRSTRLRDKKNKSIKKGGSRKVSYHFSNLLKTIVNLFN